MALVQGRSTSFPIFILIGITFSRLIHFVITWKGLTDIANTYLLEFCLLI